jgi:hypothetical protein
MRLVHTLQNIPHPMAPSYDALDIALLGEPVASQPYTCALRTSFVLALICTANSHAVSSKQWPPGKLRDMRTKPEVVCLAL